MEETKTCTKCGRELPISEFSKCKGSKDGLQPWCKECKKQYRADNSEHMKQYNKQWYADNLEYHKQYYADNAEAIKERQKQYRADNADAIKQYHKQRYVTLEGYAYNVRCNNLRNDRKYGRIAANEDPLPPIEQYIELLQQPDYYDGKQYHWSEMGLDRIDNSKPHTLDNVVPCTTEHNVKRNIKSFEEFCEIMKRGGQK